MATSRVTVPFEAKDMISGAVRNIRFMLQGATRDVLDFRRASDRTYDDFLSGGRRARNATDELGRRVNDVTDEVRRLGSSRVDDLFGRARRGADHLRSSVHRADAEIRGMRDSRVHLRARDEVSPVLDGISSKITALAATAGAIVIGGSVGSAMFGEGGDYHFQAARSAAFLTEKGRERGLETVDELYTQGVISNRTEGAKQLADVAPLVRDKSRVSDFLNASSKIQYIRPDAGSEEVQRALAQSADTFKESYSSVADSMMYAYKEVGDRQQDLFDTFWEYSGYFKNTGAHSGQMAHFLTQSVKEGAFNFDKPADFIKETFGVKALDAGDMQTYFELRGSGKEESTRQAEAFTTDINSGDKQRARGALLALVSDLASQTTSELKASLVSLGSATAEDTGISVMKTYRLPFQEAPSGIAGTTERLVKNQQEANPMQEFIRMKNETNLLMKDMGKEVTLSMVPAMREFRALLSENKEGIQELGTGISGFVSGVTRMYKDHFEGINRAIQYVVGAFVVKKLFDVGKGIIRFTDDLMTAGRWVYGKGKQVTQSVAGGARRGWDWIGRRRTEPPPEPPRPRVDRRTRERLQHTTLRRGMYEDVRVRRSLETFPEATVSTLKIRAMRVYVNGPIAGRDRDEFGNRHGRRMRRGRNRRRERMNPPTHPGRRGSRVDRQGPIQGRRVPRSTPPPDVIRVPRGPRPNPISDPPELGSMQKIMKVGKKLAKVAGIAGTVAAVGMSAKECYEAYKEGGFREAVSTRGGAMLGSVTGGVALGAIGSFLGPLGTAVGSAAGSWLGEKVGGLADAAGLTRQVVDTVVAVKDAVGSWTSDATDAVKSTFGEMTDWLGITSKEKPIAPPPKAEITFGDISPEAKRRIREVSQEFGATFARKGFQEAVTGVLNQPEVKKTRDSFTSVFSSVRNVWSGKKAKEEINQVGVAVSQTTHQTKQLGVQAKGSTEEMVKGAKEATHSLSGMSMATKKTAEETKHHLSSIHMVLMQGHTWGSDFITRMATGMASKLPFIQETVSGVASTMKDFLGFHSPTKRGPASQSDRWARNFVSMFSDGLEATPIRKRVHVMAEALRPFIGKPKEPDMPRSILQRDTGIPIAKHLNQGAKPAGPNQLTIQNINMDLGELAKGMTNFTEFATMLSSPEGRAVLRKVFGEELYKVIESGGL